MQIVFVWKLHMKPFLGGVMSFCVCLMVVRLMRIH